MNNSTSLVSFKAISDFVSELIENTNHKNKPLKLYSRLITKTTLSHDKAIEKHVNAFQDFCIKNRNNIKSKNYKDFNPHTINYSENVYIDIKYIFENSEDDTKDVIWKHILYISALVDPAGKAKEILEKNMKEDNGKEANFLSSIIDKVEQHVDPNSSNPMDAISSIMGSGILNDLMGSVNSGISDGQLDLGKLMGTVQNMVSSLSQNNDNDNNNDNMNDPMSMITKMMGSLGDISKISDKDSKKSRSNNADLDSDDKANADVESDDKTNADVDSDDKANADVDSDDKANADVDSDDKANADVDSDDKANADV